MSLELFGDAGSFCWRHGDRGVHRAIITRGCVFERWVILVALWIDLV